MAYAVTFGPRPVHVRFVVGKLALGQVIPSLLRFSPVGVFPPLFHTLLQIAVAFTGMTEGRSKALLKSGSWMIVFIQFLVVQAAVTFHSNVILQMCYLKFCFINGHCFDVTMDIGDVACDVV